MAHENKGPTAATPAKVGEMREAVGQAIKNDERPGGTKTQDASLVFEGLGNLADFPLPSEVQQIEGTGTHCVVLSDILSGADGNAYAKGQVHRISKLVPNYDDPNRDIVKANVRRLIALNAIRIAAPEEVIAGFVDVTPESESDVARSERSRRLAVETENETLRRTIDQLQGKTGTEPTPPGKENDPFEE